MTRHLLIGRAERNICVTRFGSIGKEDEEVRGDEPTIRLFNSLSPNNNHNNRQLRQSLCPLRQGRARARDRAGFSHQDCGCLLSSLSDNHWN